MPRPSEFSYYYVTLGLANVIDLSRCAARTACLPYSAKYRDALTSLNGSQNHAAMLKVHLVSTKSELKRGNLKDLTPSYVCTLHNSTNNGTRAYESLLSETVTA